MWDLTPAWVGQPYLTLAVVPAELESAALDDAASKHAMFSWSDVIADPSNVEHADAAIALFGIDDADGRYQARWFEIATALRSSAFRGSTIVASCPPAGLDIDPAQPSLDSRARLLEVLGAVLDVRFVDPVRGDSTLETVPRVAAVKLSGPSGMGPGETSPFLHVLRRRSLFNDQSSTGVPVLRAARDAGLHAVTSSSYWACGVGSVHVLPGVGLALGDALQRAKALHEARDHAPLGVARDAAGSADAEARSLDISSSQPRHPTTKPNPAGAAAASLARTYPWRFDEPSCDVVVGDGRRFRLSQRAWSALHAFYRRRNKPLRPSEITTAAGDPTPARGSHRDIVRQIRRGFRSLGASAEEAQQLLAEHPDGYLLTLPSPSGARPRSKRSQPTRRRRDR